MKKLLEKSLVTLKGHLLFIGESGDGKIAALREALPTAPLLSGGGSTVEDLKLAFMTFKDTIILDEVDRLSDQCVEELARHLEFNKSPRILAVTNKDEMSHFPKTDLHFDAVVPFDVIAPVEKTIQQELLLHEDLEDTFRDIVYTYRKFEEGDCDPTANETNQLNDLHKDLKKIKDKITKIYNDHL